MARSSSPSDPRDGVRQRLAVAPLAALSLAVTGALVAVSGRYGYHRDELYFLAAGRHLAWGYPDQPPLVPAIARAVSAVAPGSLPLLRLPSAVAMGGVVWTTGVTARALGGERSAQVLAAASVAVSSVLLAAGHLLSTTTFQLLTWSLLTWILVRLLSGGDPRWWLGAGVVTAVGLLDNVLMLSLVAALSVALLMVGPREVLRSRWLVVASVIAAVAWAPYLQWQAAHGWPQLEMSRVIAAGSSGSSQPRWAFLPFQLVLVSPYLAPVWVAGLWRLLRDPALRPWRAIAVAYLLLVVVVLASGGKPYYVAGLYPALLAAGAPAVVGWWRRGRTGLRRAAVTVAFVLTATAFPVTLPLVPVAEVHRTAVVALNYDAGETIGWPDYVDEIAAAYDRVRSVGGGAVGIVTSNYGEAGAVDRYGAGHGLPKAASGHNGFWYWGPPAGDPATVVAVGFNRGNLARAFASCTLATQLDNHVDVDDDEQHAQVWVCHHPRLPWALLWPTFRVLG